MRRPGRLRRGLNRLGNLVLGVALLCNCGCGQAEVQEKLTEPDVPKVRVFLVEAATYHLETKAWGRLQPGVETRLSAQVAGAVSHVSSRLYPGNIVSASETLVQIDPRDYRLALVQHQSQLASAELSLHQEQAEAEAAATEWREQKLLDSTSTEQSPGYELATRQPQLRQAKAQLEAARATVEKARLDLARTEIKAPYSAWVTARWVEPGQYVRVGDPIAEIQSTDFLEARLPVSSRHLKWIEQDPTAVRVMLYPQDQPGSYPLATTQPERVEPKIDPETGLGHLVVRLNPRTHPDQVAPLDPLARAGALVAARIVLQQPRHGFWIPRASLLGENAVIVAKESGTLERREVRIAADHDTWLAVSSGLEAGDRVCLSPPLWASDGMPANAVEIGTEDLYEFVGNRPPPPLGHGEMSLDPGSLDQAVNPDQIQDEPAESPGSGSNPGPPPGAPVSLLTAWSVQHDGEALRVHLTAEAMGEPKLFALDEPHRWVVDFRQASWPHAPGVKNVDSGPFRRVRLAQFNHDPPIARLVVEVDRAITRPTIQLEPHGVEILFEALP